jgi:hypothetical protein
MIDMIDNLKLEYRPEDFDYDPRDNRKHRNICVVPHGVDMWTASCDHMLNYGTPGLHVHFAEPGETPQQTVARYRAFHRADMARDRARELAGLD